MKGSDVFHEAFSKHWFLWKEKNRVGLRWVKVVDRTQHKFGDDSSNVPVILVHPNNKLGIRKLPIGKIKNLNQTINLISYYKLFNHCTVVEEGDTLNNLLVLEAKLRLLT